MWSIRVSVSSLSHAWLNTRSGLHRTCSRQRPVCAAVFRKWPVQVSDVASCSTCDTHRVPVLSVWCLVHVAGWWETRVPSSASYESWQARLRPSSCGSGRWLDSRAGAAAYSLKSFYNVGRFYSNRDAQKIWGEKQQRGNKSTSQKTIDNIEPRPLFILCCAWQFLSDCHLFFLFPLLFLFLFCSSSSIISLNLIQI